LGFAFSQEQVARAGYKVLIAMFFTTVANHIRTYQIGFYYSLVKYSTACIEPRTYVLTLCSDDASKEKKP